MRARDVATVDCETDPFLNERVPEPFIWGFYDGGREDYQEFATGAELVAFLNSAEIQRRRLVVYAHNGGRFDYHYLLPWFNTDEPIMVIGGRIAKFRIGTLEFRDSFNILPVPLKAFAKEDIDYSKLEAVVRHLHMDEIRRYLRLDCTNLYDFVTQYQRDYGRGLTQAGAAMNYWQTSSGIKAPRQSANEHLRFRPYYYGGRVQCFRQGVATCEFRVMDINSAYPFAMLHAHPYSTSSVLQDHLPPDGEIGPCLISLDAVARGCFPLRADDESLYFPDDGTVRTYHVTGWELLAAMECDAVKVISIREVHRFTQHVDFKDYIEHFYALRQEAKRAGDKARDVFAKILMNALYGKFGADPSRYEERVVAGSGSFMKYAREGFAHCCYLPGHDGEPRHLMSRPLPDDKQRFYNVATAASITGFVRAELFKAIQRCEGVIYCDTDSIAARDVSRLPVGLSLGEWKEEMSCDHYAVAGKKLYAFRDVQPDPKTGGAHHKIASKGAKLTAAEIARVANGETILYNPLVPTYSLTGQAPQFIRRDIRRTARDISIVPDTLGA